MSGRGHVIQLFSMEPHVPIDDRHGETSLPFPDLQRDTGRDQVATPVPTSPGAATIARHLYTMTVDQVLAELYTYKLYRDVRTIQRWCKSGKLRAIIDDQQGDRYLVDPASVRDMVATLLEERDAQTQHPPTPSRPMHDPVGAARPTPDTDATAGIFSKPEKADTEPDVAAKTATPDATSEASRDEVAALQRQVAELEKEKFMLSVDKQARDSLIDFMKEKFDSMLEVALDRTEELGRLRSENTQLRALLPAQTPERGQGTEAPIRYSPESVQRAQTEPLHNPPSWRQGEGV